jgi:hypothetical protein
LVVGKRVQSRQLRVDHQRSHTQSQRARYQQSSQRCGHTHGPGCRQYAFEEGSDRCEGLERHAAHRWQSAAIVSRKWTSRWVHRCIGNPPLGRIEPPPQSVVRPAQFGTRCVPICKRLIKQAYAAHVGDYVNSAAFKPIAAIRHLQNTTVAFGVQ